MSTILLYYWKWIHRYYDYILSSCNAQPQFNSISTKTKAHFKTTSTQLQWMKQGYPMNLSSWNFVLLEFRALRALEILPPENWYHYMAKSFDFAKKKLSNGLKGYVISRALVQGCSILVDRGTRVGFYLASRQCRWPNFFEI